MIPTLYSSHGLPSVGHAGVFEPVIVTLAHYADAVARTPILDAVGRFWHVNATLEMQGSFLTLTVKNPNKKFDSVELVITNEPGHKDTDCLVRGFSTQPLSACRGTADRDPQPSDPMDAARMARVLDAVFLPKIPIPIHEDLALATNGLAHLLMGDLPHQYRYVIEYIDDRYLILTGAAEDSDLSFELFIRTEQDYNEEKTAVGALFGQEG